MTALTLSRGDTSQIRYEGIVTVVQEIASAMLVDALGDQSSFDLSRQRRAQQLKERRKNTKAATGGGRNKPNADTGGGGGGVPRTVHASKVRRNIATNQSGAAVAFDLPEVPVLPPESHNPLLPPVPTKANVEGGGAVNAVGELPPPSIDPLVPFCAEAQTALVVAASDADGGSGGALSLRRRLSMASLSYQKPLPSCRGPHECNAADILLSAAGWRADSRPGAPGSEPIGKPRNYHGLQRATPNSIQCGVPSGAQDDAGSPLHGQMSDSKSTRLSLSEAEQLEMFAAQIGRVVLSHLPAAAVDILVNRLHIPNFRKHHTTGKYPATVPKASLRHFGQRIVAITNTDLSATLHNARAALAFNSHNTSGTTYNVSARSGIATGNSGAVADDGGSTTEGTARFDGLANSSQTPSPVLRTNGGN
jgi:hypothetical protein